MVDKTINIFNPTQKPFGALSNNSYSPIIINNEEWKSVTQYVYTQIQCKPSYRTLVRNQKNSKLAKKVAIDLYIQCIRETTLSATKQALKIKFKDPKLAQALLATGESFLFYDSPNNVLGSPGENLLGKYLREIRNNLRVEAREKGVGETEDDKVYKIYLASRILEEELLKGKDINKYKNKSYDAIISVDPTLKVDKGAVIKLYKAGKLDIVESELRSPGNLVLFVLKEKRVLGISAATRVRRDIISNMYVEYIIEQKYPEITTQPQKRLAVSQAFKNLTQEQIKTMEDRIINLYNSNKLEQSLQNKIKQELDKLISEKDIEEEIIEAPEEKLERPLTPFVPGQEPTMPSNIHFSDAGTDPKWAFLSPAFPHMLSIDGRPYPTVIHYTIASLLANLHSNYGAAHKLLMIDPDGDLWTLNNYKNISDLNTTFEQAKEQDWVDTLKGSAKIALDVKFDNIELQNVLLLTGTSTILYTDKTDGVLGTGPDGQGMNFTGTYLMEVRANIKKYKVKEGDFLAYVTDIAEAQAKIPGLKEWILSRIRDAIVTASRVRDYLVSLTVSDVSLDKKLAVYVIQTLYDPCKNISFAGKEIGKIPSEINNFIKKEAKNLNLPVKPKGIFTLWKYAGILTFSLLVNLSGKKPISRLQELKRNLLKETKHCWGPFDEVERNCAFSAILNVAQRLISISQAYGKSIRPGIRVLISSARIIGMTINELGNETHETKATIRARIKDYLVDAEISESFLSQFTWLVNRVTDAMSENVKLRNRVHFFAEYYDPYVEVGEKPKKPKEKKKKLTRKEIELMKQAEEFTREKTPEELIGLSATIRKEAKEARDEKKQEEIRKAFREAPTAEKFKKLPKNVQERLYTEAEEALAQDKGDPKLAQKIINMYYTTNLSKDAKRGLRALLLAIKFLTTKELSAPKHNFPKVIAYSGKNIIYEIIYESKDDYLPKMFFAKQEHIGISKEILEYYDNLKNTVIAAIGYNNVTIDKIDIDLTRDKTSVFYKENIGVIWDLEKCANCITLFKELGIDCSVEEGCEEGARTKLKKLYLKIHPDKGGSKEEFVQVRECEELLIEDECLSKIRHHP